MVSAVGMLIFSLNWAETELLVLNKTQRRDEETSGRAPKDNSGAAVPATTAPRG